MSKPASLQQYNFLPRNSLRAYLKPHTFMTLMSADYDWGMWSRSHYNVFIERISTKSSTE